VLEAMYHSCFTIANYREYPSMFRALPQECGTDDHIERKQQPSQIRKCAWVGKR
jgi:hypothetical protein